MCNFCKEEPRIGYKAKESEDNEDCRIRIDEYNDLEVMFKYTNEEGTYCFRFNEFDIKYCPICGEKIK